MVYILHGRATWRAGAILAARALRHPKVEMIWNTVPTRYLVDEQGEVEAVETLNLKTRERSRLDVKCVFVAIGHQPNTRPFIGKLDMDANGYLRQARGTQTNRPGVFAAGDVADAVYRQAVTAAGQGCAAAIDAERYLVERESARLEEVGVSLPLY
jgi:thioredoxin reductase (NADPH)